MFIRVYVVGTSSGVNVSGTIVFLKQSDNLKRTNKVKSGVPSADGTLKVSSFLWICMSRRGEDRITVSLVQSAKNIKIKQSRRKRDPKSKNLDRKKNGSVRL